MGVVLLYNTIWVEVIIWYIDEELLNLSLRIIFLKNFLEYLGLSLDV